MSQVIPLKPVRFTPSVAVAGFVPYMGSPFEMPVWNDSSTWADGALWLEVPAPTQVTYMTGSVRLGATVYMG